MVVNGHGIVLGFVKYGDSSVIAKVLTKDHGLTSFLIQGVFRKKAKISASVLQPFSLLEIVYYYKENRQLHKVKEAKATPPLNAIQLDVVKSAVSIFACEILQNVLKNIEQDQSLFNWVKSEILSLNSLEKVNATWPHMFLVTLAKTQGFAPSTAADGRFFHLKEGVFTNIPMSANEITTAEETLLLKALLTNAKDYNFYKDVRNGLLDKLIAYFAHHVGGFRSLKTIEVLRSVLN